jgi:hypothetical protein
MASVHLARVGPHHPVEEAPGWFLAGWCAVTRVWKRLAIRRRAWKGTGTDD